MLKILYTGYIGLYLRPFRHSLFSKCVSQPEIVKNTIQYNTIFV